MIGQPGDGLRQVTNPASVIYVEGESDRAALTTLAGRRGRNLEAEGVQVVAMGGASALAEHLKNLIVEAEFRGTLAGMCDEAEVDDFRLGLEQAGLGSRLSRSTMEAMGFFVCIEDLEDELIRALGVRAVEAVLEDQGELRLFRTFQNQPAWRGQPVGRQLRRFLGVKSGRKIRYGSLLVEAMDLDQVPHPLEGVLAWSARPPLHPPDVLPLRSRCLPPWRAGARRVRGRDA